jgi:PIN domain nuclease of toxin-antitoxin system
VSSAVLDASAVLAVLLHETGADRVIADTGEAHLGTVNLGEVLSRLSESTDQADAPLDALMRLQLTLHPFDEHHAALVGQLRPPTKPLGLSFGDRACLALALALDLPVLTSDRRLAEAASITGLDIRLIR